ncbi:MAG: hypothetical protein ACOZBW_13835 [Thermodesulfobacteriota bacterium]
MAHQDAGKYRAKHPPGTAFRPDIAEALTAVAKDGRVTCAAAHKIAAEASVPVAEVGKTLDLLEFRLTVCQLGLFGYPEKKRVKALSPVPDPLKTAVLAATQDSRISCAACWEIADALGLSRMEVAGACETLGLRVKPCQLGAF